MIRALLGRLKRRIWKPAFVEAGFRQRVFHLPTEGEVHYAEWLHLATEEPVVTQERVDFYKRFVRSGDLAIDIGTRDGDTTIPMALAAGADGMVLAIDPNPHAFKILAENARMNREKTHIVPLNFAAAAADGEYTFGSGDPSFLNGGIVRFSSNRPGNSHFRFTVEGKDLARFLTTQDMRIHRHVDLLGVPAARASVYGFASA